MIRRMHLPWSDIVLLSVTGAIVLWSFVFGILWFREWWTRGRKGSRR
jgi:hypothetical protein